MSICQGLLEDQDISGVGVRVTFYAQSFLTVLASALPGTDIDVSYWALAFTTFSLLISAIIEANNNNLTLYNAILVSYLCTLHAIASESLLFILALFPVKSSRSKVIGVSVAAVLQCIGSTAFGCYIWQRGKTFGSQPECNADTKMIFFGKSESATQHGGQIAIGWLAGWIFPFSLPLALAYLLVGLSRGEDDEDDDNDNDNDIAKRVIGVLVMIYYLPYWLYIVITMEVTIQRNPVIHGPTKFGFGQVFPLISIGLPLYAILSGMSGKRKPRCTCPPGPPGASCPSHPLPDSVPFKAESEAQTEHERPAERSPEAVPPSAIPH